MAGAVFSIHIDFRTRGGQQTAREVDQIGKHIRRASNEAKKAEASFRNLAGAFTAIVVAQHIKNGIVNGFLKPAIDLENKLKEIQAITGATQAQMQQYENVSARIAKATKYNRLEVLQGMQQLRLATGSGKVAMESMKDAARLAVASFGQLPIEDASKMVGNISKAYGATGNRLTEMVNNLAVAAKTGGLNLRDYYQIMEKLSAGTMLANQSFEDLANSFALVRRVDPSNLRAATRLFQLFTKFDTVKFRANMGSVVDIYDETTRKMLPMSEIFSKLYETMYPKTGGGYQTHVLDKLKYALGGSSASYKAITSVLQAMKSGLPTEGGQKLYGRAALDYMKQMQRQNPEYLKQLEEMQRQTLGFQIGELSETLANLGTLIGKTLVPVIRPVIAGFQKVADVISDIMENWKIFGGIIKTVGGVLIAHLGIMAVRAASYGIIRILKVTILNLKEARMEAALLSKELAANAGMSLGARLGGALGSRMDPKGLIGPGKYAMKGAAAGHAIWGLPGRMLGKAGGFLGKIPGVATLGGMLGKFKSLFGVFRGIAGLAKGIFSLIGGWGTVLIVALSYSDKIWEIMKAGWKWLKSKVSFGDNDLKSRAEAIARQKAEVAKKEKEAAMEQQKAAKALQEAWALGGSKYNEVLEKAEKLMQWEPAIVDYAVFQQVQQKILDLQKKGIKDQRAQNILSNLASKSGQYADLTQKYLAGELTPQGQATRAQTVKEMYAGLQGLKLLGYMDKATIVKFVKQVGLPTIEQGSEKSTEFGNLMAGMSNALNPATSKPILGMDPATSRMFGGGFQDAGQEVSTGFTASKLVVDMAKNAWQAFIGNAPVYDWTKNQAPGMSKAISGMPEERGMAANMEKMVKYQDKMYTALNNVLKVEIVKATSGNDWSSSSARSRVE